MNGPLLRRRTTPPIWLATVLAGLVFAADAWSQDAQIALEKGPHYTSNPVLMRIVVRGFEEQPTPKVEIESQPPSVRADLASIDPQVSSSIRITTDPVTGRLKRSETKSVVYSIYYRITADTAGTYQIGPFTIRQNGKQVRAEAVSLAFQDVAEDPNAKIRLVLPDGPMYPDQRVPVTIEFWYAGDFGDLRELNIYTPLFDTFPFAPDPTPSRNSNRLPIQTKDGPVQLAADVRKEDSDGKEFLVVTSQRTMIPDRPGTHSLGPVTATLRRVTKWARSRSPFDDFPFGGGSMLDEMLGDRRRAVAEERTRAVGASRDITVKPFPAENRPDSFAGAVGSDFSLDVSAARTEVRVGDPITLTVTLRGSGNIENARLPKLSADGGLHPDQFRLPETEVSGRLEDGAKIFEVTTRVEDANVSRVPGIAYSWFDPQTEEYKTTRSKPIALNVMAARVVSAADVVSSHRAPSAPRDGSESSSQEADDEPAKPETPTFTLSGADLAIEPDPQVLLQNARDRVGGTAVHIGLYVVGLLLIAIAIVGRRRSDIPIEVLQRRKRLRGQRQQIERARNQPRQQAADGVASALRAMVAEMPDTQREAVDKVVMDCEAVAYAPTDSESGKLADDLMRRALTVADQIIKEAE